MSDKQQMLVFWSNSNISSIIFYRQWMMMMLVADFFLQMKTMEIITVTVTVTVIVESNPISGPKVRPSICDRLRNDLATCSTGTKHLPSMVMMRIVMVLVVWLMMI